MCICLKETPTWVPSPAKILGECRHHGSTSSRKSKGSAAAQLKNHRTKVDTETKGAAFKSYILYISFMLLQKAVKEHFIFSIRSKKQYPMSSVTHVHFDQKKMLSSSGQYSTLHCPCLHLRAATTHFTAPCNKQASLLLVYSSKQVSTYNITSRQFY